MIIDEKKLQKYHEYADSFELLTPKREKELAGIIRKFKQGKQKQKAREELMNHNLRLVIKEAFRFYNEENSHPMGKSRSELDILDLISAGNVGLMKAVDLYNPRQFKTRFSTYAIFWIKQGMMSLMYNYNAPVHIPTHIVTDSQKYKKITKKNPKSKKKTISDNDMMEILDVTEKGLRNIKNSKVSTFSMDIPLERDHDGNFEKTYKDLIPDKKQEDPYEKTAQGNSSSIINEVLKILDPMSRDIIDGQYLNAKKVNLKDLGKKYGITGERVRQIKRDALAKIRRELKKHSVEQF